MKKIYLFSMLLLACMATTSFAHPGYHIRLKFQGVKDSTIYLTHYYGKPLPSMYKRDSARIDKKGNAEFVSYDSTFVGGIYMVLLADRKTYFEFLLNSGDDMSINVDIAKLPQGLTFKNSMENENFQKYVDFLKGYSD